MVSAWAQGVPQGLDLWASLVPSFRQTDLHTTLQQTTFIIVSHEKVPYVFVFVVAKDHCYFNSGRVLHSSIHLPGTTMCQSPHRIWAEWAHTSAPPGLAFLQNGWVYVPMSLHAM